MVPPGSAGASLLTDTVQEPQQSRSEWSHSSSLSTAVSGNIGHGPCDTDVCWRWQQAFGNLKGCTRGLPCVGQHTRRRWYDHASRFDCILYRIISTTFKEACDRLRSVSCTTRDRELCPGNIERRSAVCQRNTTTQQTCGNSALRRIAQLGLRRSRLLGASLSIISKGDSYVLLTRSTAPCASAYSLTAAASSGDLGTEGHIGAA